MKETDIDSYLRENKPQIKDNPTFILEVKQKMRAVDGIKNEVDRQRKRGRLTMAVVSIAGLILGVFALVLAMTFPTELKLTDVSLLSQLKDYFEAHAEVLLVPVTLCAVFLSIALGTRKESL